MNLRFRTRFCGFWHILLRFCGFCYPPMPPSVMEILCPVLIINLEEILIPYHYQAPIQTYIGWQPHTS